VRPRDTDGLRLSALPPTKRSARSAEEHGPLLSEADTVLAKDKLRGGHVRDNLERALRLKIVGPQMGAG